MRTPQCLFTIFVYFDVASGATRSRSLVFWFGEKTGTPHESDADWKARIANLTKHSKNFTGVSPVIYGIDAAGRLGKLPAYDLVVPHLPALKALGLDVFPLIGLSGGLPGLGHVISADGAKAFIESAVATATAMNYDGYNVDVEARGKSDYKSWSYLLPYAKPYMEFLNKFADAMHAVNKTLTADIGGCCDWFDSENPKIPAGHCGKGSAYSHFEFVATTCIDYAQSRLDHTYAMSTYSDSVWNASSPYGPSLMKKMVNNTIHHIGIDKYAIGFKGGWHVPDDNAADAEVARQNIDDLRNMGVHHACHWYNEATTQAEWDAWGYFLRDDAEDEAQLVLV